MASQSEKHYIVSAPPLTFNFNHLFDPSIPAEHKLLFAHASVAGYIEDHEEVTDELSVHPSHANVEHIRIKYSASLLVRFPLLVSEESLANCCELIDVDGIVPLICDNINVYETPDCRHSLVLVKSSKTRIHCYFSEEKILHNFDFSL